MIEDAGVLADPAYAGFRGGGAFDQRAGIDVAACLAGETVVKVRLDFAEASQEFVVIVGGDEVVGVCGAGASAPGIAGDPSGSGFGLVDGERGGYVIAQGADDDRSRPGHRDLDVTA